MGESASVQTDTMDRVIPTLPSLRLDHAAGFYRDRLGFEVIRLPQGDHAYLIVRRGDIELHFFLLPELEPDLSHAGCYLHVSDVDGWHEAWSQAGLAEDGIPRISPVEDKPWGMREFHLVDPDGNLLRVGQRIHADAM